MKSTKVKLLHKSFITNQDLIEGIRNHSFVSARQPTPRLHTEKSKVSLIKKKSYERLHTDKENTSLAINQPSQLNQSLTGSPLERAIALLQDCLASLGDHSQKMQHKLKKALNCVREITDEQKKLEQQLKIQYELNLSGYIGKLQKEKQECSRLSKTNQELKAKLADYRQKIISIRKEASTVSQEKQPPGLHQIIINQSQIIDQQCDEYQQQNNQMRRLLKTQALQIEQLLAKSPSIKDQIRQYTSLGSSFLLKH